jgi:hypothetical protein
MDLPGVPLLPETSLRVYWGLEQDDDSYAEVVTTSVLSLVTRQFENYCQRGLAYRTDLSEEIFNDLHSDRLYLWSFPIVTLKSVSVDGTSHDISNFVVNKAHGWIQPKSPFLFANAGQVVVVTDSGFQSSAVPDDLAAAYANAVGVRVGVQVGGTLLSPPGSPSSSPIKSIGLGGGALSVAFETSSASRAGGITGAYDVSKAPVDVQPYASVLDQYKRTVL